MALVEIKDFNALIDNKPIFDQPVTNKQEQQRNKKQMENYNRKLIRFFVSSKIL